MDYKKVTLTKVSFKSYTSKPKFIQSINQERTRLKINMRFCPLGSKNNRKNSTKKSQIKFSPGQKDMGRIYDLF